MSDENKHQPVTPNPTNFAPNHRLPEDEKVPGRQENLPPPIDDAKPSKQRGDSAPPLPPDVNLPHQGDVK